MADTQYSETSMVFFRIWEFLQEIYQEILRTGLTTEQSIEKDRKFEWTQECQEAFDTLKQKFMEEPVLMMPEQSRPYQIEADASKYASGTVLTQTNSNGDRHPVAFCQKPLLRQNKTTKSMIGNYLE